MKTGFSSGSDVSGFYPIFLLLGGVLVIAGSVLLIYIAWVVYQIINDPQSVQIASFLLERIQADEVAVSGFFRDAQDTSRNIEYELRWSESVRTAFFLFIGVVTFGIFVRIGSALVTSGTVILKFITSPKENRSKES
ncbi:MAG: hypothetical protein KDI13_08100 [Alphaproteobacteria bacterium]|nr:hypothetical protein [Alphaproteobacteria bacterium]